MRKVIMVALIMMICILPAAADAVQEKVQSMKQNAVKNMEKLGYTDEEIGQAMNRIEECNMNQEQKINMYKWMTRLENKMEFKNLNEEMENKIQNQNKIQNKHQNKAQPKPKYKKQENAGPNK